MGRLAVLLLVAVVVVWLLRRALSRPRSSGGGPQDGAQAPGAAAGDLVSCAHCGVNLPKSEARSAGGRHYCSEEHWRAGPREG